MRLSIADNPMSDDSMSEGKDKELLAKTGKSPEAKTVTTKDILKEISR